MTINTSGCLCPESSPYPSCYPSENIECKILFYMGENNRSLISDQPFTNPGQLSQIYTAEYSEDGWSITDYSAIDLFKSAILPDKNDAYWTMVDDKGKCLHKYFDSFTLFERELLACETMETWKEFGQFWLVDNQNANHCKKPFIILVYEALGIKLDDVISSAKKALAALKNSDACALGGISNLYTIQLEDDPVNNEYFLQRLEACWLWFKNIYDTYYGKQFLVKIGEASPSAGGYIHGNASAENPLFEEGFDFRGICVKNQNGNYPKFGVYGGMYYIQGNGNGQGFSVSDEVSNDGGFPASDNSALGLSGVDLDFVRTEDGKIESFIKVGHITGPILGQTKEYPRFGQSWYIDFTTYNSDNYLIKKDDDNYDILYLKASVDDKIYFISLPPGSGPTDPGAASLDSVSILNTESYIAGTSGCSPPMSGCSPSMPRPLGQWALIHLSEPIKLSLYKTGNPVIQIVKAAAILQNSQFSEAVESIVGLWNAISSDILAPLGKFGTLPSVTQTNLLQIGNPSLLPAGAVIPMKSNIYNYGPYFYNGEGENKDTSGGTEYLKYDVLAPWNFSIDNNGEFNHQQAYERMNCAGVKIAQDAAKSLQQLEKGRITIAELPSYSLGHSVDDISIFPDKDGPTILTDISVDYGSSGFRTTYNFQTFTPKFGRESKKLLENLNKKIKENNANSLYLKQQRLRESSLFKGLQKDIGTANKEAFGVPSPIFTKKASPNNLLISGYYYREDNMDDSPGGDDPQVSSSPDPGDKPFDPCKDPDPLPSGPSTEYPNNDRVYSFAETEESYQATFVQKHYNRLHIMSIDGLYLPVSLKGDCPTTSPSPSCNNTGKIARFSMRTEHDGSYTEWKDSEDLQYTLYNAGYPNPSKTRDEIPPFKLIGSSTIKSYSLPINQQYLNPMLSTKILESWDSRKNNSEKGFVISSIAFGDKFTDYQLTHNDIEDNPQADDETIRQQQENFRFSALRGPLVLQGWGYDTSGKPIPNSADTPYNTERGKFKKSKLTDKFMKNWIENPRTWPVGPVDLRFDRERGVWTCPSPNKIVVARLKQTLRANGKAIAELINPEAGGIRFYQNYNISGPNGENIKLRMQNAVIVVYDFIGVDISANDLVYAYYDDNRYIVLESGRAYKGDNDNNEYWDVNCTTTTPTTTTPTTPTPECPWCGLDCLKTLPNYNDTVTQVLGHEDGCLKWFDITDCEPSPSPSPDSSSSSSESSSSSQIDTSSSSSDSSSSSSSNSSSSSSSDSSSSSSSSQSSSSSSSSQSSSSSSSNSSSSSSSSQSSSSSSSNSSSSSSSDSSSSSS